MEEYLKKNISSIKRKNTNLERYGVEHVSQHPEIQEKIKRTNLERYGVENPSQHPEIKEKIKRKLNKVNIKEANNHLKQIMPDKYDWLK